MSTYTPTLFDVDEEMRLWRQYKGGDKSSLGPLMLRFKGLVNSWVNQHKSPAIPDTVLKQEAWKHVKIGIDTYDARFGAKLTTHIRNKMRKGTRLIHTYADVARLPEQRSLLIRDFKDARATLTEKRGRPPSVGELYDVFQADRTLGDSKKNALSLRQIARLEREVRDEVIGGNMDLEQSVTSTENDPKFELGLNIVYQSLAPRDQKIFEHTTGYLGQPVLKNVQIARLVGVSPTTIGKKKKRFQGMMDLALR